MIKDETSLYYQQKVNGLLDHIGTHLDGDLSVRTLSLRSGISLFHFHRIMKAALGEPLGSYIDRVRLDTAVRLIRNSDEPLNQIAISIGYNDLSSFSKAFTREFGLTPGEFRRESGMVLNTQIDFKAGPDRQITSSLKPKTVILTERRVVFTRVHGKYGGEEADTGWKELEEFARHHRLLGWNPGIFAIYYDDPDVTGHEACRSDLCISTRKSCAGSGRIGFKDLPGGQYTVFRYKGPYELLWKLYDSIYGDWVLNTGLLLRDQPVIEKYLNYSPKTRPEELVTEIYLPVEGQVENRQFT